MATQLTREQHEMVVRVLNLAELREYNEQLAATERRLIQAKQQLDEGKISQTAYNTIVKANANAMMQLNDAIAKGQAQTRDYRQGVMALSYVFNDFFSVSGSIQQRIIAISNNLPMLMSGFGGVQSKLFTLGLAASGLLPLLAQLGAQLDFKEMAGFKSKFDLHTASLEELRKKVEAWKANPPELPLDLRAFDAAQEKLDKLTKATQAYEATRQTAEKADIASQAASAVRETIGSEKLAGAFAADMVARGDKSVIPQALLDERAKLEKEIKDQTGLAKMFDASGQVEVAEASREVVRRSTARLEKVIEDIQRSVVQAGKDKAGLFASGDVGAIAAASRLPAGVLGQGGKEFQDRLLTLPKSAADVRAMREDAKQREIEAEQAERERLKAEGIAKAEEANRGIVQQREQAFADLTKRVSEGLNRVLRDAGEDLKRQATEGLAAGRPRELVQGEIQEFARKRAQDLGVGQAERDAVAQRIAAQVLGQAVEGLPAFGGTVPRRKPRTTAERVALARARKAEEARQLAARQLARRESKTAEGRARQQARRQQQTGVVPGRVTNPAQDEARKAQLNQAPNGKGVVEAVESLAAQHGTTFAVMEDYLMRLLQVANGAASATEAQRRAFVDRFRAMQVQSQSYLGGW